MWCTYTIVSLGIRALAYVKRWFSFMGFLFQTRRQVLQKMLWRIWHDFIILDRKKLAHVQNAFKPWTSGCQWDQKHSLQVFSFGSSVPYLSQLRSISDFFARSLSLLLALSSVRPLSPFDASLVRLSPVILGLSRGKQAKKIINTAVA